MRSMNRAILLSIPQTLIAGVINVCCVHRVRCVACVACVGWKGRRCTPRNITFAVETTMGMGFPVGMGIPRDSHGNGNWWQNLEWEWEEMGNNLHGNGNGHYSHGNQFTSADTVLSLCNSTVYCKLIMVIGYYVIIFSTTIFLVSVL